MINVLYGEQTVIEKGLRELGVTRRRAASLPYHSVASRALAGTALVATIPSRMTPLVSAVDGLAILRAPVEIELMQVYMAWHARLDDDPAQVWLRQTVREVIRDGSPPPQVT